MRVDLFAHFFGFGSDKSTLNLRFTVSIVYGCAEH